jgi:hypothetical protein
MGNRSTYTKEAFKKLCERPQHASDLSIFLGDLLIERLGFLGSRLVDVVDEDGAQTSIRPEELRGLVVGDIRQLSHSPRTPGTTLLGGQMRDQGTHRIILGGLALNLALVHFFGIKGALILRVLNFLTCPALEESCEPLVASEDDLIVVIGLVGAVVPVGSAKSEDGILDCVFVGRGWNPLLGDKLTLQDGEVVRADLQCR